MHYFKTPVHSPANLSCPSPRRSEQVESLYNRRDELRSLKEALLRKLLEAEPSTGPQGATPKPDSQPTPSATTAPAAQTTLTA